MTITEKDFLLFGKLMALTTSDNDGEALAALRKANAILKRGGLTWQALLFQSMRDNVRGEEPPMRAQRTPPQGPTQGPLYGAPFTAQQQTYQAAQEARDAYAAQHGFSAAIDDLVRAMYGYRPR